MRILHIIQNLKGGGRERRMLQLVSALIGNELIEQRIVLLEDIVDYDLSFIKSIPISIVNKSSKLDLFSNLRRVIGDFSPDIVHSWCDVPFILLFLPILKQRFKFKYIAGFVASATPVRVISKRNIENQLTFLFADRIISNSKAGLLAQHCNFRKSRVIYNGFNYARFSNSTDATVIKADLGIQHSMIAGMFARFTPAKDYDLLINVAHKSEEANLDICFLAIGDGPLLDTCKERARILGLTNIIFTGFRSDVEDLILITDVCILFTNNKYHAEGISNSIVEAMAAGKPVIATNSGGTPEIVSNGENGFLVEPGDAENAFKHVRSIVADQSLLRRLGNNAQETIQRRFLLSTMASNYIALYNELLAL